MGIISVGPSYTSDSYANAIHTLIDLTSMISVRLGNRGKKFTKLLIQAPKSPKLSKSSHMHSKLFSSWAMLKKLPF